MTPRKGIAPDLRRRLKLAVFVCVLLDLLFIFIIAPSPAESSYSDNLDRRYTLIGSLELNYDRSWSPGSGAPAVDDFRQVLILEQRGYVSDPQLLTYQISGLFSHDAGKGAEAATLMGGDLGLTLFRSLPAGWQKNSDYIPHPFYLRYSRESGTSVDYTSYGLSFVHSVAKKKRFLEWGDAPTPEGEGEATKPVGEATKAVGEATKPVVDDDLYEDGPARMTTRIVEKDGFPFPTTFFDYDHYDLKAQDSRSVNDILSLRSSLTGKSYDYGFLYEKQNQKGSLELQRSVVQLVPNYRFYDEETHRRIEINNLLRYENYNQTQNIEMGSNSNWTRPIGKNELSFRSDLGYTGSSSAAQTAANYSAAASGIYKQYLSPRLTNSTSLIASFLKNNAVDTSTGITQSDSVVTPAAFTKNITVDNQYSVRLSDYVLADISRLYNGLASVYVGDGSQGIEYGTSATLSTKTRITTSLSYSYNLSSSQGPAGTNLTQQSPLYTQTNVTNGKTSQHNVALLATGPLLNNLVFQARADFTLSEAPAIGGTSSQETGSLSGNMLWRLPKSTVVLGGNYSRSKNTDSVTYASSSPLPTGSAGTGILTVGGTSSSTSLFANLTRVLPMRMLFNLYSNWTKSASTGVTNSELTRLELRPTLRWTRGKTTVDTEYSYTRSSGGGESSVDQRFFVRLVRSFAAVL